MIDILITWGEKFGGDTGEDKKQDPSHLTVGSSGHPDEFKHTTYKMPHDQIYKFFYEKSFI